MQALLNQRNPMPRLHALWLLTQQRTIQPNDLKRLIQDPDPGIRENAYLCLESLGPDFTPAAEWLVQGWMDSDPRVARQAALTSSVWPAGSWSSRVKLWEEAVKKQTDPWTLRALAWVAQTNAARWMAQFGEKSAVPLDFWLALLPLALDQAPFNEEIMTALAGFSSPQLEPMLTSLGTLMEPLVSVGSWPQLNEWEDNPTFGRALVSKWPTLSPGIRKHIGDLLLYVPEHHNVLMTALEAGQIRVGEMNFDLERRRTLLWWTPHGEVKRRAKTFFSDTEVVTRKSVVEAMKPALHLTGVASSGQVIFKNICSGCHQFGSIGQEVGPNLTEISRKSKATLLREIVDPNAAVDPKYIQHKIELKNGQVHWGIIAQENDRHYVVKKMGGESVTILKKDIQDFRSLGTSLMMEGLEASLSHQQMADLLAYLQTGL